MHNDSLLQTYQVDTILLKLRVRLLQIFLGFIFIASVLTAAAAIARGDNLLSGANGVSLIATLLTGVMFYVISRGDLINVISNVVLGYFVFLSILLYSVTDNALLPFLLMSLTAITSALVSKRSIFWLVQVSILALILWIAATLYANRDVSETNVLSTVLSNISAGVVPLTIGLAARYFMNKLHEVALTSQRTSNLLSASTNIGQSMAQMLELNELLNSAVEIIRDRFAFYHVSIFLLDEETRYAHLTASTGEVGERMLARKHRLPIDANSVIGRVSQAAEVIVTRDAEQETGHSYNELLPDTRSELAVPILDNEGIIGALDVQSRRSDAFTPMEIQALQVIASQLATAIRNARLFEDKEHSIRENKRLFIDSETSLREIQRLNRQLTRQAWSEYLKMDRRIDGVTLTEEGFKNSANWSDHMVDAGRRRRAITNDDDGMRTITVPIELRGEVVGAIEVETTTTSSSDDTVDMIRAISQRLAVSLDNARLFEESHEATAQEQRVSEIVAQYQSANSVDELLQITLEGLAETLGAEEGAIRLGILPEDGNTISDTPSNQVESNGGVSHD